MSNTLRLSLMIAASAALLSACATPATQAGLRTAQTSSDITAGRSDDGALYGLYLSGQAALNAGRSAEASELFARARAADPAADELRDRAFIASLMSGDIARAAAAAPPAGADGSTGSTQTLGTLAQGVELIAADRGPDAYAKLSELPLNVPHGVAAALLRPWAAAEAGKWDAALALPSAKGDKLLLLIASLDQAMLFERAKRYPEAETAFKALMSQTVALPLVAPAYGAFLERRGRRAEAVTAYDAALATASDDPSLLAARARAAGKGAPPPQMSIREGAAQALMAPAAQMQGEKQLEIALVYLRLILRLDPARDDAWLYAGQILATVGDQDSAREAYEHVGPSSPRYVLARSALAASYQGADKVQALKIVQETAASHPDDPDAQIALAEMLRANDKNIEAARIIDPLIAQAGAKADWRLYYLRGAAFERADRWTEAQADFTKALSLKPDDAELLNYVGYSYVSRGQKVKEGMAMIQKAVGLEPDNGAYIDSLGWSYYQLGDYRKAVEQLERAAELMAGDPEINDHLGDAYWRAGRRQEARFQWTAVLTLGPTPEQKPKVEAKLASPMGVDAVVAATTVARQ
jgi:tetratricopeptide (TPR) repeat protein